MISWDAAFAGNPLVAILRGLAPDRAVEVTGVLYDAGFRIVEVPLNSPRPLDSIKAISDVYGDRMIVGAGTVLTTDDVDAIVLAGGRLIVAPNLDLDVGARAAVHGAIWCPGIVTPTEAFLALRQGAVALKVFPAEMVSPRSVSAMHAVLPPSAVIIIVGGITPSIMAEYYNAGVKGFGLGSALFKPEYDGSEIAKRANVFKDTWEHLRI